MGTQDSFKKRVDFFQVYLLIDSIEDATKADQDKAEMREERVKKRRLVEMQYQADELNLREKLRDLIDIVTGSNSSVKIVSVKIDNFFGV